MSSQTDVANLVALLSNGQADTNLFALEYSDVVNTLGPTRWHTNTAAVNLTEGNTIADFPAAMLNLLAVLYDGRFLSRLELRELEVLNSGWRNAVGTPIAYTLEAEPVQTAELYPAPYTTSPATAIYVENRTNVLPILTLPVALLVLQREFSRQSDHVDPDFAALCGTLGQLLLDLLVAPENFL